MIVLKNVEDVVKCTLQGQKLEDILKKLSISPLEFFKYLENDQQAMKLFESAKIAFTEMQVANIIHTIDKASTPFELDKAVARGRFTQWVAEKLIPKTYGNRIDVNQNVTIDIRAVLASANSRVDAIDTVRANAIPLPINRGIDSLDDVEDSAPTCGDDLLE